MARMLAAGIASRTGLCVVEPTLTARALGLHARTYDQLRVREVADTSGARWLVRGEVALDEAQPGTFTLKLDVYQRAGTGVPLGEARTVATERLAFSDEVPPEAAYAARVMALVDSLALPGNAAPPASDAATATRVLPATLDELVRDPGSAIDRAERLQLVAVTYAQEDIGRETLWERSLIALAALPDDDETARVLRARANLYLYRRPHAVKLLAGLASDEARTLAALADGNLPEAEAHVAKLQHPVAALISAVELERLRARYGATAGHAARRDALLAAHAGYAVLLQSSLSSGDWFHLGVHVVVQQELAARKVSLHAEATGSLFHQLIDALFGGGANAAFGWLPAIIERGYAPLWERRAVAWRAERAHDRLAGWDVYDALFAANRAALVRSVHAIGDQQGRPQAAFDLAEGLDPVFLDYPPLAAEKLRAAHKLAERDQPGHADSSPQVAQAREIYRWEGGETHVTNRVDDIARLPPGDSYADEPPREWRPLPWNYGDRFASTRLDAKQAERYAAHYSRALRYTQHELWYLERTCEYLSQIGRAEECAELVRAHDRRFVGHHRRAQFLAARARNAADTSGEIAVLEEAIRGQPEDWSGYMGLARAQLRAWDMTAAQRALNSFPPFAREPEQRVALANHAHDGGNLLARAGEPELARPLFERARDYRTGAAAEMWSGLWLALYDEDYGAARDWAERLHRRYRNDWGLTDAAIFSFLTGDAEGGWQRFDQATREFRTATPWEAAFVGHRMAGTDRAGAAAFAGRWKLAGGPPHFEALLREHFLFNLLMIDRAVDEETLAIMAPFAGKGGDRAFVILSAAYHAFKRGDYAGAVPRFRELDDVLINVSVNAKRPGAYTVPYTALALAQSGKRAEADALAQQLSERVGRDFYFLLARAYLEGMAGRGEAARQALWHAFIQRHTAADLPIDPSYQLLEACEKLLELTGDAEYRALLLDMTRRLQRFFPYSWAYTFEARHAADAETRLRAAAIGLYLDPRSERLAGLSEAERKGAQAWLAKNNPFRR
jgi:hypothetical protein